MFRIDSPGATPDNKFSEGDPANGTRATVVTDEWLNAVQEELANAVQSNGQPLDKADSAQLARVLKSQVAGVKSQGDLSALTGMIDGQQVSLSGPDSAVFEFDDSDLSGEVETDPKQIKYVPPATDISGASGAWVRQVNVKANQGPQLKPRFVEQFINGFGGRGMLAAEVPNVTTEQNIAVGAASGATSIGVADASLYEEGGRITVYHDTVDSYETYFVLSLTTTAIGIAPGLRHPVTTNSLVERTWYNQAHPGKFYMRRLAQQIARGIGFDQIVPNSGRLYFSQLDSDPVDANDQATAINGAGISYVDELNVSQGFIDVPLESSIGRSLFITVDADGEGASLPAFKTYGVTHSVLSFVFMSRSPTADLAVRIKDADGFIQTRIPIPKETQRVMTKYNFPIKLPAKTSTAHIEIVAEAGVSGSFSMILDQIEVFAADSDAYSIPKRQKVTVVALGDSWVAGDLASTTEREPITQQLEYELPMATIINSGVGGNKVQDLLDRFESDVVPFSPDYVIVNVGTNDAYNPASATFFPNSVDFFEYKYNELLGRIIALGAQPIIVGMPALAENDGAYENWLLNDRAKTLSRYFWKRFSQVLNFSPIETSAQAWTPELEINGVTTGITYSARSANYVRRGDIIHYSIDLTLSSKGAETGFVTISGFPISSLSGVISPAATTALNVASATSIQAVHNIGPANKLRLQIPTATGTSAATEANLTDTSRLFISGFYYAFDG
ncbi:GDSL-like lipase/acylhydrolase family protein [Marinobacter nauticus]|uniref:GDSL-like lipase/acylhydrolase family protein n=1 Tax=Marinobacter nauticus TaxID=2743 RepID=A0A368X4B7_MARNT|nr:SGNH/GDSL hydrolase family protein [Marinobacter nauticus]RCW62645.1 GDSL-like lipase/acylhydrolase family protein [Marinobacter nauticus]